MPHRDQAAGVLFKLGSDPARVDFQLQTPLYFMVHNIPQLVWPAAISGR